MDIIPNLKILAWYYLLIFTFLGYVSSLSLAIKVSKSSFVINRKKIDKKQNYYGYASSIPLAISDSKSSFVENRTKFEKIKKLLFTTKK